MDALLQKSFGKLDIKFEKNLLKEFYQQGASKAIIPNNYRRFKELVLVNTSGGMTSGDSYLNNFNLSGSDICITTQTAEKIYSGFGQPAKLNIATCSGYLRNLSYLINVIFPEESILI